MSWMDSWSRPSKSQATPAPFYLLPGGESTPYCHSCGRVINSRRNTKAAADDKAAGKSPIKYCSSSCRAHKPGKLDREIESVFVRFLSGEEKPGALDQEPKRAHKPKKGASGKKTKGDARILVSCDEVESHLFGPGDGEPVGSGSEEGRPSVDGHEDGSEIQGQTTQPQPQPDHIQYSEQSTGTLDDPTAEDAPYVDGDVLARLSIRSGTRIRPPQSVSEVNGSVGGEKGRAEKIVETDEMLEKRRQGQRKAKQREMVRCAARRGVVFGLVTEVEGEERRKCEAVMNGKVVEPSFAKGNWLLGGGSSIPCVSASGCRLRIQS
ncbi:hypothetical protein VPNG_03693 [Cytospora leucostoma]|uniref:Uncharacterized protein n=1 Tax=Cytospora leucostoma TaxID=1230097 RepID=A0A423XF78_9PEZI|nr:hypothetical protein VPNG_03693 [Cytospora leucostoma]